MTAKEQELKALRLSPFGERAFYSCTNDFIIIISFFFPSFTYLFILLVDRF